MAGLGAARIRELAQELNLTPTKQWGQNFVIDPNTVGRIVHAARLVPTDVVVEVGPGLGSLTVALAPQVSLVEAVEIDPRLAALLPRTVNEVVPDYADRVQVINADAMHIHELPAPPTALVANLPYNVAVPVIIHFLETFPTLRTVLVMVQKEVADRLCAEPGSRTYGVPSIKARWFGEVEAAGTIGRTVFWPAPHVDSGLVRITCRPAPPECSDRARTFTIVDAAFGQRRKTLRSALSSIAGSPQRAEQWLCAAQIDPGLRGEQLSLRDFCRIAAHAEPPTA